MSDESWPSASRPTGDGEGRAPEHDAPVAVVDRDRPATPDRPGPEPRSDLTKLALALALVVLGARTFGMSIFLIIGALTLSIVLHEWGHFWVARRSGMKVTEFFVGIGPKLWSFRRGEVEYGIKAIPVAAYVRIIGMNPAEEIDPVDEPRTYRRQGTFKRLATVLAGPGMNLLIAFVLLAVIFMGNGRMTDDWRIQTVEDGSAADAAGLATGDRILDIDGKPVNRWEDLRGILVDHPGETVNLTIERRGERMVKPVTLGWRFDDDTASAFPSDPPLTGGDVVTAVNGTPVPRYDDLRSVLRQAGPPATLRVMRNGHPYDLSVDRPYELAEKGATGFLGVGPGFDQVKETPIGAVGEAGRAMGGGVTATGAALGRLFTPSGMRDYAKQVADATQPTTHPPAVAKRQPLTPVEGSPAPTAPGEAMNLDRPIGIVGIVMLGNDAAKSGVWDFFSLVAGVNLALAILNLIPMYPFDGGHAAVAAYEGIRGRLRGAPYRADLTKLMPVAYVVLGFLLLFMVSTTLLDVLRPPQWR